MGIKFAALGLVILSSAGTAWAVGKEIKVGVKGMVCGFCAQGIEKKFNSQSTVDQVNVNLGQKQVKLTLKDGQALSDDTIKSVLEEAGYNVEKIERN